MISGIFMPCLLTLPQAFSNVSGTMRLYHPSAFDFSSAVPSYWEATAPAFDRDTPPLRGAHTADVAIIGGGYAGLHAALVLAREHGLKVRVLEAGHVGWGASGRNGGFCCPGAVKLTYGELIKRFGLDETKRFYKVQRDAVRFVGDFLAAEGIDAQRTGEGEMEVAHKPSRVEELKADQRFMHETFGDDSAFYTREELAERGFDSPAFHAGLQSTVTFGLHPLRYVRGLARVAVDAGVALHANSEVIGWETSGGLHTLKTREGEVSAKHVLVATNGYTDETLPAAVGGRLLPALTRIIVTRPISDNELKAQGWTSTDPTYDTRRLLHYFRLLPDNRMLFGGRGGTDASPEAMQAIIGTLRQTFEDVFPAWKHVETEYSWGGFVCLTSSRAPFAGPVPGMENVWGAFGWHGNGVAMASYAANRLAHVIAGAKRHEDALPAVLRIMPGRFIMPSLRVQYLKAAYVGYGVEDRWR